MRNSGGILTNDVHEFRIPPFFCICRNLSRNHIQEKGARMRTLKVLAILLTVMLSACSQPAETPQTQAVAIENDYIRLMDDLTALMSANDPDPAKTLENIRKYVTDSREVASGMLNKLNQEFLNMTPEERETWRRSAKPRTEAALERYANAQMLLHQRLNDAQKWELGEILGLLR